jgi:hypothetical protein
MSGFVWHSPWPQWRTHWHVWHAWPLLAQALLLSGCGLIASAVCSAYWSNEAWQAWWNAEATHAEQQQLRTELQHQLRQLQVIQDTLQAQSHPSGLPLPAWQALPKPDLPKQAQIMQLAQQHGLQVIAANDEGGQWQGPLPHLLAAWQQLNQAWPQQRLVSFELTRLDSPSVAGAQKLASQTAPPGPLVTLRMAWRWTTTLEKEAGLRPVALGAAAKEPAIDTRPASGAQLLHNLFAPQGLVQVLPPGAQPHTTPQGLAGHSLNEMQWMGMLSKAGHQQALVMHAGLIHTVRLGQAMGQDFGEVVQMAADHVLLREWRVNAQGQWQAQTVRFPSAVPPCQAQGAPC